MPLVRHSTKQATTLIAETGGARPGLLAGYRVKVLGGNALAGREHRLAETRGQTAVPLPGKMLLVFNLALDGIGDWMPVRMLTPRNGPCFRRCWSGLGSESRGSRTATFACRGGCGDYTSAVELVRARTRFAPLEDRATLNTTFLPRKPRRPPHTRLRPSTSPATSDCRKTPWTRAPGFAACDRQTPRRARGGC